MHYVYVFKKPERGRILYRVNGWSYSTGQGENDEPHYGLKEHASVDIKNGFILATKLTPAVCVPQGLFTISSVKSLEKSQSYSFFHD